MRKSLLIPTVALCGIGAALLASSGANAQASRQAPLMQSVLADAAKSSETTVIEVQSRRVRRNRRGIRRGVRPRSRRRGRRSNRAAVAAGIAGAIIGGAIIANERARRDRRRVRRVRRDDAHVNWCYDRYRSYRERDNTYQPYSGRRRQCISPYY